MNSKSGIKATVFTAVMALSACSLFPLPLFAQIVGPNPQNTEYILPSPNPFPLPANICHMFNYEYRFSDGDLVPAFLHNNRLIAISYTSLGSTGSFVALRRLDAGDNPVAGTDIPVPIPGDVKDVEAGFLAPPSGDYARPFLLVTYYRVQQWGNEQPGHYARLYIWDLNMPGTSCTLYTPPTTTNPLQLSSATQYGRISLDIHHFKRAIIVWEEGGQISLRVAFASQLDPFINSNTINITNVENALLPDVSYGGNRVFISYLNTQDSKIHTDLWTGGNTVTSSTLTPVTTLAPSGPTDYYASSRLNLAAYAVVSPQFYKYGVIYNENIYDINLHMVGAGVYDILLTDGSQYPYFPIDGSRNYFPAISADNAQFLTCAWYSEYDERYFVQNIDPNGVPITDYWRVSNKNGVPDPDSRIIALSNHTMDAGVNGLPDNVMASYPVEESPEIDYKFNPIGTVGFRPGNEPDEESGLSSPTSPLSVYPNPFRDYCQVALTGAAPVDILDMELMDIFGRIIRSASGTVEDLNRQLQHQKPLQSGWYIIKLRDKNNGKTYTQKITRL